MTLGGKGTPEDIQRQRDAIPPMVLNTTYLLSDALKEELKDLNNVTDLQAHDKLLKLKYLLKKKNNLAFLNLLCLILIFLMVAKL